MKEVTIAFVHSMIHNINFKGNQRLLEMHLGTVTLSRCILYTAVGPLKSWWLSSTEDPVLHFAHIRIMLYASPRLWTKTTMAEKAEKSFDTMDLAHMTTQFWGIDVVDVIQ